MKKVKETLISTDIPQDAVPENTKKIIKIDLNRHNYIVHKYNNPKENIKK